MLSITLRCFVSHDREFLNKPMVCQTYGLQLGGLHENDGNHDNDENDKDTSENHKQEGCVPDQPNHGNDENHGNVRGRKMNTNFFRTNFLNTPKGSGTKFPGHPRFLTSKPKEDKLSREGTNFSITWKTSTPPGGLWTQKVNLCALFSCLKYPVFFLRN